MEFVRKVALLLLCFAAQASVAADQGFYFGLSGGQAKYDFDFDAPPRVMSSSTPSLASFEPYLAVDIVGAVAGSSFSVVRAFWLPGEDDKANAFSGIAGYRIAKYAAVELTYARLGTLREYQPALFYSSFLISPPVTSELETSALTVSALATIPLTGRWNAYLRGGALFAEQKVSHSSIVFSDHTTYGSNSLLFGAGTQFDFGNHWTARLDFQRYDSVGKDNGIGEADVDVWSLGVLFRL
jgi:opacity protein-like surface antigen